MFALTYLWKQIDRCSVVMGRKLNLNHLTDDECNQVLKVIQRDFDIRQQEKGRLSYVPAIYTLRTLHFAQSVFAIHL